MIALISLFRPYGSKPFDVTEDGEVEKLSIVKVCSLSVCLVAVVDVLLLRVYAG